MKWPPSRAEAAEELLEQAASCRRLALGARTAGGSAALRTVADQFESDASRINPVPVSVAAGDARDGDSEALVRVRMALELQLRNGFGIRPIRSS